MQRAGSIPEVGYVYVTSDACERDVLERACVVVPQGVDNVCVDAYHDHTICPQNTHLYLIIIACV